MISAAMFVASGTIISLLAMLGLEKVIYADTGLPAGSVKVELTTVIIITLLTLSLLSALPVLPSLVI